MEERNNKINVSKLNISYYNEIADSYESFLSNDRSNEGVREKVEKTFCDFVKPGLILDFGGGTGLDLSWLTGHGYTVVFCEPAAAMRQKAIDYNNEILHSTGIEFLPDKKADFRNWNSDIPFSPKATAVLLNFAVLNCIPDIDRLFESLALMTFPGAHLFALILESGIKTRSRANLRGFLLSLFTGETVSWGIHYKEHRQTVYLHTVKSIRKSTDRLFSLVRIDPMPASGFSLIHLTRE